MKKTGKLGLMILLAAGAVSAYAQESYSSMKPEFSTSLNFASGIMNIDENASVDEIPGVSSEYSGVVDMHIKGSFSKASEYGVEREDGIEWKSQVGYEAGLSVDAATLYKSITPSVVTTTSNQTNNYLKIQKMIDWYEANCSRFGLPYSPFVNEKALPTRWPTDTYGASSGRYVFINGSTVEPINNVKWTTSVWGDANDLYQIVRYAIDTAIDQLYTDKFATGNIDQDAYSSMSSEDKRLAELKMRAKREWNSLFSTSSTSVKDSIGSAYFTITNIANVVDARIDFLGKRITAGDKLFSYIAGQNTSGSAVTFNLKKGLVQGLDVSVSTGIAGGLVQNPENYETKVLDYYAGLSGEWSVGAKAKYTMYIEPISSTLSVYGSGVWTDILVANKNFAADLGVNWKGDGFVNYGAGAEAMILNWKDRDDDNMAYKLAYSALAEANVRAFGITADVTGQYKSANFEHKLWTTEDRFYGYGLDSDYYIANAQQAAKVRARVSMNPEYFLTYDIVEVVAGAEAFLYGDTIALDGFGLFGKVSVTAEDLINLPLTVYGSFNYYKNSKLLTWDDYDSLPEQTFMDFSKYAVGISYSPVKNVTLGAEYASAPSASRRISERLTSFTVNGTIKLD